MEGDAQVDRFVPLPVAWVQSSIDDVMVEPNAVCGRRFGALEFQAQRESRVGA